MEPELGEPLGVLAGVGGELGAGEEALGLVGGDLDGGGSTRPAYSPAA